VVASTDFVRGAGQAVGVAPDDHRVAAGGHHRCRHALADSTATASDEDGPIRQRELHRFPFG
jgi:hypothetical protein